MLSLFVKEPTLHPTNHPKQRLPGDINSCKMLYIALNTRNTNFKNSDNEM